MNTDFSAEIAKHPFFTGPELDTTAEFIFNGKPDLLAAFVQDMEHMNLATEAYQERQAQASNEAHLAGTDDYHTAETAPEPTDLIWAVFEASKAIYDGVMDANMPEALAYRAAVARASVECPF